MHPDPVEASVLRVAMVALHFDFDQRECCALSMHRERLDGVVPDLVGKVAQQARLPLVHRPEAIDGNVLGGRGDVSVWGQGGRDVLHRDGCDGHGAAEADDDGPRGAVERPALAGGGVGAEDHTGLGA